MKSGVMIPVSAAFWLFYLLIRTFLIRVLVSVGTRYSISCAFQLVARLSCYLSLDWSSPHLASVLPSFSELLSLSVSVLFLSI